MAAYCLDEFYNVLKNAPLYPLGPDIVGVLVAAAWASSPVLLDAATAAAWRDGVISQMTMRALLV